MKKLSLNLYESPTPLENTKNLWVDKDEKTGDIKVIHRFKNNLWNPYLVALDYLNDDPLLSPSNNDIVMSSPLKAIEIDGPNGTTGLMASLYNAQNSIYIKEIKIQEDDIFSYFRIVIPNLADTGIIGNIHYLEFPKKGKSMMQYYNSSREALIMERVAYNVNNNGENQSFRGYSVLYFLNVMSNYELITYLSHLGDGKYRFFIDIVSDINEPCYFPDDPTNDYELMAEAVLWKKLETSFSLNVI